MKILNKDFRSAFDRVAHLATKRTSLPILNAVNLSATKGVLSIAATDLDCFGLAFCPCEGDLESVNIPAFALSGLIKCAGESIELSLANNRLSFKSNGNATLAVLIDDFPWFPDKEIKAIGISVEDLADGIDACKWATDASQTERAWAGSVHVKASAKEISISATTGQLLARVKKPLFCHPCDVMVVARYAGMLCEVLREKDSQFLVSDKHIAAKSAKMTLICKQPDCTYPRIGMDDLLKQERVSLGEIESEQFTSACQTATMLAGMEGFAKCSLEPTKDGIQFTFVGFKSGHEYRTKFGPPCTGDAFKVDALKAKDALSSLNTGLVKMSLGFRCIFLEQDDYTAVISVMS